MGLEVIEHPDYDRAIPVKAGGEGGDDLRIPLAAGGLVFKGCDGVGELEGLAVGAVAGEGVEDVGHLEDARGNRDGVGAQTVGIAATVPVFVVVTDDGKDMAKAVEGADDGLADDGVGAHDLPFVVVEGAGLEEDGVGDADLADIVQVAGALEGAQVVVGQTALFAEGGGEVADAFAMIAGFKVAGLDAAGKSLQDLLGAFKVSIGAMGAG